MTGTTLDDYLDLVEVARILQVHPSTIRRLVKAKRLPVRLFAGKYLFDRDAIYQFHATYDNRPGRKSNRWKLI